ncbi:MAG: prolipoprotein diacylglyceryl transferase [Deltaproteobacteria bacterium]|nr:prolipoprotein diacylglyceryl transferase [Deltaproteobacteria bacterium]
MGAPLIWDKDPILWTIPWVNWPIRYYGLFFALAFLLGFQLFRWQIARAQGSEDEAVSFILPGFLGVLLGARLGHILFYNLDRFLQEPLWFFRFWEGGLASHGAAVGLVAALLFQAWRRKRPFWDLADRFSFAAATGAALVRVGNFFNSEIVGRVAPPDFPFSVAFPRHDFLPPGLAPPRYPTQIAESLLGFFVLGALFLADRLAGREKRPRGLLAALFLVLYFAGRFFIEFWKERQNEWDILYFSRGQLLSIAPFLLGIALLIWIACRSKKGIAREPHPPRASRAALSKPQGRRGQKRARRGRQRRR